MHTFLVSHPCHHTHRNTCADTKTGARNGIRTVCAHTRTRVCLSQALHSHIVPYACLPRVDDSTSAPEWHGMVWYGMVWCGVVWYGMVWMVTTFPLQSSMCRQQHRLPHSNTLLAHVQSDRVPTLQLVARTHGLLLHVVWSHQRGAHGTYRVSAVMPGLELDAG